MKVNTESDFGRSKVGTEMFFAFLGSDSSFLWTIFFLYAGSGRSPWRMSRFEEQSLCPLFHHPGHHHIQVS